MQTFNKNAQKGAMFGLDARIVLIIFASLSLIGFASLTNSISDSRATSILTELQSVKNAYQNFINDTKYKLTSNTNPYYYNIAELIELTRDSSKPYTLKYRGPYIKYSLSVSDNLITHPSLKLDFSIISRSYEKSWSSADETSRCTDTDCFSWVVVRNLDKQTADDIDLMSDGENDTNNGKVRITSNGSGYNVYLALDRE